MNDSTGKIRARGTLPSCGSVTRCILGLALILSTAIPAAPHRSHHPGILLLYFRGKDAPYAIAFSREIGRTLEGELGASFDMFSDSTEGWTGNETTMDKAITDGLKYRYSRANIHVVVPIGADAIEFVRKHGANVFPEAVTVYMTFKYDDTVVEPPAAATGVVMKFDAESTLQIALRQNPGTRHVLVVAGTEDDEKQSIAAARRQFSGYASDHLDFKYVNNTTYADLLSQIATLDRDWIVLLFTFWRDSAGDRFLPARMLPYLSRAASRPIYVLYPTGVGAGAVGGQVHDFRLMSQALGRQVAAIVKGTPVRDIPIQQGTFSVPMFDWQQMRRWGISEAQLPPGSIVLNHNRSLLWQLRWWIFGVLVFVLAHLALTVRLVVAHRNERRARESLATELEHEEIVAEIAADFVNLRQGLTNEQVKHSCARLLKFYSLDRMGLYEFSEDGISELFHYSITTIGPNPLPPLPEASDLVWVTEAIREGKVRHISSLDEIPNEALPVRKFLEARCVKSFTVVPLKIDSSVRGALAFSAVHQPVQWTPALIKRLQTVADIFSSGLERKNAEESLQGSEELNRNIIDSLRSLLCVVDSSGKTILVNERWKSLGKDDLPPAWALAARGENYLGQCRRAARDGDKDAEHALAGILSVLDGGRELFEMQYKCGSSEQPRWFTMWVTPLLNRIRGAVVRHVDVTFRAQADAVLRESEERYRTLADSTPIMLWMSGTEPSCTQFNKAWLDFTGRTLEQEQGDGWAEGIHPEDRERSLLIYNLAFGARHPFTMQYRLRRFDGDYRWVIDTGIPRHLSDGTFAGFIGGCVDVTEQKESEAARLKLSGLLITAQEQERASIARELHDHFNQRLALLAIELQQFTQSMAKLTPAQRAALERLFELTTSVSNDVQSLSHRLHSSKLQLLGLLPAIQSLCEEFSRISGVDAVCAYTGLPCNSDPDLSLAIFRVVQEALRNTHKYGQASNVKVDLEWKPDQLCLRIRDDGIGFDPAVAVGTGLGLISMQERLRLVGGALNITSKAGGGTLIEAHVPLAGSHQRAVGG